MINKRTTTNVRRELETDVHIIRCCLLIHCPVIKETATSDGTSQKCYTAQQLYVFFYHNKGTLYRTENTQS